MEELILDALFQDFKEREVLKVSPFGDIFFKEDDLKGGEVYSVCQILPPTRPAHNPAKKGEFMFLCQVIAFDAATFQQFLKVKRKSFFKRSAPEEMQNLYDALITRFGLRLELKKRLGKTTKDQVYGYCSSDPYNSTNPNAEKVDLSAYHKEVLKYIEKKPRQFYSDIWELNSENDFGLATQKLYYGYGFELPQGIFSCTNLKCLSVANQTVQHLYPGILKLKSLNELTLRNVSLIAPDLINKIYKFNYLVSLTISRDGDYYSVPLNGLPPNLEKIKSLKYLDFSGNKSPLWSSVVKITGLKTLNLSNTSLNRITSRIKYLNQLEELDLSNNKITELPESLVTLKRLKVLRLNNNPLLTLPNWIGKLKQLEVLDLQQTQLTSLPDSICNLTNLKELNLKKNSFVELPASLLKIPTKIIKLELQNQALYNNEVKNKLEQLPSGDCYFESDFNFKLMVINKLMYVDEVLYPKFNVHFFAKNYKDRKIDIEEEGYAIIPEVAAYFKKLPIPATLLLDIVELLPDGGDEIYAQLIPFWSGEDDSFDVKSIEDIKFLPSLETTNSLHFSEELVAQLEAKNINVIPY
ncbi:leucine-rich repeat domain-containing protein [Cellulophaga omnivescoria]|uniref:leucine-rich repeat domain-containing protein n=1 Tax=Cellulophaga omnivescoria TaxID=1888890 RepID=UPI0009858DC8|nr:leucine-rich repeat domain-containing protein [Cellulophaga omnivescoria]WBU88287.1 leucine-rich repeat domain-containing protein [Cellulophaga omnivescoria]